MDETVGGGSGGVSLTRDLGSCPIIIVVYYIISLYYMCIFGGGAVFRAIANNYTHMCFVGTNYSREPRYCVVLAGEENRDPVNPTSVTYTCVYYIIIFILYKLIAPIATHYYYITI